MRQLYRVSMTTAPPAPGLLMSMRDISQLAGVQRPVVTNWRRRDRNFPAPVGGDENQPLFDARQVAEWLIDTRRAMRSTVEAELSLHTLSSMCGTLAPRNLIAWVTALICLRRLDGDSLTDGADDVIAALRDRAAVADPDDTLLLAEILSLPASGIWLATAVDELVEAAWGCKGAFEQVMRARHRLRAAEISANAVTPQLAMLIAKLSGAAELAVQQNSPIIVSDPSAGPGDLLAAAIDLLGPDHVPVCTAAERDPYLARLIRRRLAVHELELSDMDVYAGGVLPDESGYPDVIVTQIPYVPSEDRSADEILAAVDDISLRLDRGSTAVILGPADVLADELPLYSLAERARWKLLSGGTVEAIIRLPGGLIPFRPGYETALWVLNSAPDNPWQDRILLADVSDRELTDEVAEALVSDILTWRRPGYDPGAHHREFGVQVRRSDLEHQPKPFAVRPPRNIRTERDLASERVTRVLNLEGELNTLAAEATTVRQAIPRTTVADVHDRPPVKSIGRLAREPGRLLAVVKGTRLAQEHVSGTGHHAVFGANEVLGVQRPGKRLIERTVLADRYPNAKLTHPGDVLVTIAPEFGVLLDEDGYSVAEYPVRVLRITEDGQVMLTPRVLTALLGKERGNHRPFGAIRESRRLEDYQIAMLPPAVVADLDVLLAELDARRRRALDEADMLEELAMLTTAGLSDGTLALAGDKK